MCRYLGVLLGITFEVQGLENVQKEKGGVVLMNHQSGIDLISKILKNYFLNTFFYFFL